jgi:hypothetical protein
MASDPKASPVAGAPANKREKGVRIFTYPKIIFIFPSLIMALICWIGMYLIPDVGSFNSAREKENQAARIKAAASAKAVSPETGRPIIAGEDRLLPLKADPVRFKRKENLLGLLFLGVFMFNLIVLAIDFPRFTIFALLLLGTTILFFMLWLGMYVDVLKPLVRMVEGVYVVANAQFYLLIAIVLLIVYGVIFLTRYLDYWEIMPNEILHHHGPLSDLERYPTLNLKFDKEIPDVFEHLMFGAGRLVLHVSDERKAIVLDTVLHVSRKEEALKKLMSRLEVRVTTDQEVGSS